ncbi:MAG: hypothetical protein KDC98_05720 [Planctomycetes bacterium]|nr:hypothetical protein [Planctomycetota bacterium]
MLSLKRGAVPTAPAAAHPVPFEKPGLVERLPPHAATEVVIAAATDHRPHARDTIHTLRLSGATSLAPGAGIATFDAATGSGLTWHPIEAGSPEADGIVSFWVALPACAATVTLAARREDARHRYLQRRDLPSRGNREGVTELVAETTPVHFVTTDTVSPDPLQLIRVDDPEWQPPASVAAGLYITSDDRGMTLGPGAYELVDPIDASLRQRFEVPCSQPIMVAPPLARPRAGQQ